MSMTLRQAIQKAIDGGWKYNFSVYSLGYRVLDENTPKGFVDYPIVGIFDDPLFWQSLYGSEKYGRMKALEFINAIFDGKSAEKFFEQEPDLGQEQQEETLS